jgi:hypothetical protein
MCGRKRIIAGAASVIKDHRIAHVDYRGKDIRAFLFLPFIYIIENTHSLFA